jgi:hypothetical protein
MCIGCCKYADRLHAKRIRRMRDANGNFAPVGNQYPLEHAPS